MFPAGGMSIVPVLAPFLYPDDQPYSPTTDYEMGGIALSDPTQGMMVLPWKVWVEGGIIYIDKVEGGAQEVITHASATQVSLAFDQNMFPVVAYVVGETSFLRWYNPVVGDMVITEYPGATNLKLTLDDKRPAFVHMSDVIFVYSIRGMLAYRVQRERYLIEHEVGPIPVNQPIIYAVGKTRGNRVEISFKPT